MKKLLSFLLTLMLLFGIAPASAGVHDLDHLFVQTLSLRDLMLEKRMILPLLGGSDSVQDVANEVLDALSGSVREVRVLRFETEGSFERFAQLSGEEFPQMSDTLRASYEKSLPSVLINQMNGSYSTVTVAATAMLTTGGSAVVPGMTEDALAVLDFGEDYQLVCVFVTGDDDIVGATAYPLPAQADVLAPLCELYGLTEADVKVYAGSELYRAGATEALRDYTLEMKDTLAKLADKQDFDGVSPEMMAFVKNMANRLLSDAKAVRIRMLPLDAANGEPLVGHAQLSNAVDMYHHFMGVAYAGAADFFAAPAVFDMPRGMSSHVIVQADYELHEDDKDYPAFSVVCVYTSQDDNVLCTAMYALYDDQLSFLDAVLEEGIMAADPAQIQELQP